MFFIFFFQIHCINILFFCFKTIFRKLQSMQILRSDYIIICVIRLKCLFFMTGFLSVHCNHLSNRLASKKKNVFSTQYGTGSKQDKLDRHHHRISIRISSAFYFAFIVALHFLFAINYIIHIP